jgi:hypothetical protein
MHHNYEDIDKTAYQTLVEAGVLQTIPIKGTSEDYPSSKIALYGFPYGSDLTAKVNKSNKLRIAVVHAYVWQQGCEHPNVSPDQHVDVYAEKLRGFDVVIMGDNHHPFEKAYEEGLIIFNCGGFMRTRTDERTHRPRIGLIHEDSYITSHYLDTSADVFTEIPEELVTALGGGAGFDEFVETLTELGGHAFDFKQTCLRYLDAHKVNPAVREVIIRCMEGGD